MAQNQPTKTYRVTRKFTGSDGQTYEVGREFTSEDQNEIRKQMDAGNIQEAGAQSGQSGSQSGSAQQR